MQTCTHTPVRRKSDLCLRGRPARAERIASATEVRKKAVGLTVPHAPTPHRDSTLPVAGIYLTQAGIIHGRADMAAHLVMPHAHKRSTTTLTTHATHPVFLRDTQKTTKVHNECSRKVQHASSRLVIAQDGARCLRWAACQRRPRAHTLSEVFASESAALSAGQILPEARSLLRCGQARCGQASGAPQIRLCRC